jgi:superfamily II DNA helicase RecQ
LEWNIKAVAWEGAEPEGEYTVVLISPEGMNTPTWDRFVNVKRAKFRIDRVVLDEAQKVLVSKEFRPPLETR